MSRTILTVDDATTMRKLVSFTLRGIGHDVVEAADAPSALNFLAGRPVDLIITDVNMPGMSGIDLVRKVRALPKYLRTPILVLTTETDVQLKTQARDAGATGWIVKPFKQEQLIAVVDRVLPR